MSYKEYEEVDCDPNVGNDDNIDAINDYIHHLDDYTLLVFLLDRI